MAGNMKGKKIKHGTNVGFPDFRRGRVFKSPGCNHPCLAQYPTVYPCDLSKDLRISAAFPHSFRKFAHTYRRSRTGYVFPN